MGDIADMMNDGGPAFPLPMVETKESGIIDAGEYSGGENSGMSLRDWFAGQMLVGLIGRHSSLNGDAHKSLTAMAYQIADAMLVAREKQSDD